MKQDADLLQAAADAGQQARVARLFADSPFVADLGIELLASGAGWCRTALHLARRHLQHGGVAHAGVITSLADHTAGGASQSLCAEGQTIVSAEFKLNLLRPGRGERLECRAEVLKAGRSLHVVEAEVFGLRGAERVLVAKFNGTLAVVASAF